MGFARADANGSSDDRIELPDEFADHIAASMGMEESPDTLGEWLQRGGEDFEDTDETVTAEDMYTDGTTRHEVHLGDDVRHTPCVFDALIAAHLESASPVTVRSIDPVSDDPVTFEVGDEWTVTPASAVVSFGTAAELPSGTDNVWAAWLQDDDFGDTGEYICPYLNAYESEGHYEQWVEEVDAVTMSLTAPQVEGMIRGISDGDLFE